MLSSMLRQSIRVSAALPLSSRGFAAAAAASAKDAAASAAAPAAADDRIVEYLASLRRSASAVRLVSVV